MDLFDAEKVSENQGLGERCPTQVIIPILGDQEKNERRS